MEQIKLSYALDLEPNFVWLSPTATQAAKKSIPFVQELGVFPCREKYYTEREMLPSFLIKYCVSGGGILEYDGRSYLVRSGQIFWLDCMKHQHYYTDPGEGSWHIIWVHFFGGECRKYYELFLQQNDGRPVVDTGVDESVRSNTFPICVLLMIIVYAIAQFVTAKTRVGRNLYAVGGSREAAFFSGINVKGYQFGTFLLGSVLATFGGLVLMSRLNSVAVTNGQNYEFDAVIGSIIGGVSLAGGKGRVIGTMFGCIFLNTLFNGFSQMGVDPFVQDVLKGVVLVLAVTLDVASNKKKS